MFKFFKSFASPKALAKAGVLNMNYRNYAVINAHNSRRLFPLVDDKVQTKKLAATVGIQTPHLIGIIESQHEVQNILKMVKGWNSFVIKPAHGSGGKGVLVIKKYTQNYFRTASERVLKYTEVYQHISNILSGLYSLGGRNDVAVLEEMVSFSDIFKDYSFRGVPDVRVIVYKGYPALAMMRLATKESGGRANLHQGAVGVGLDIVTGKAIAAVQHNKPLRYHPDTGADLLSLQVPDWRTHLEIAAKGFDMTHLGYLGADIVMDKNSGPMMLELNARPGLAIQIANQKGLANRLKEIDLWPQGLDYAERVDYVFAHAGKSTETPDLTDIQEA